MRPRRSVSQCDGGQDQAAANQRERRPSSSIRWRTNVAARKDTSCERCSSGSPASRRLCGGRRWSVSVRGRTRTPSEPTTGSSSVSRREERADHLRDPRRVCADARSAPRRVRPAATGRRCVYVKRLDRVDRPRARATRPQCLVVPSESNLTTADPSATTDPPKTSKVARHHEPAVGGRCSYWVCPYSGGSGDLSCR